MRVLWMVSSAQSNHFGILRAYQYSRLKNLQSTGIIAQPAWKAEEWLASPNEVPQTNTAWFAAELSAWLCLKYLRSHSSILAPSQANA